MMTLLLVFIITLRVFGGQTLTFNATIFGLALRVYTFLFNPSRAFLKERDKGKEQKNLTLLWHILTFCFYLTFLEVFIGLLVL